MMSWPTLAAPWSLFTYDQQVYASLLLSGQPPLGNNGVCGPYAKAVNDEVDEGDEEHDNCDDVIEDIGLALVLLLIDVQAANYQEKDANQYLKSK